MGADLLDEELVYRFGGSFQETPTGLEEENRNFLEFSLQEFDDDDD